MTGIKHKSLEEDAVGGLGEELPGTALDRFLPCRSSGFVLWVMRNCLVIMLGKGMVRFTFRKIVLAAGPS